MTLSSSEYLAMAIGTALSGGGGHHYEATSTVQYGNDIEQWAIDVTPGTLSWTSRSLRTGRIQSFDPRTMSLHDGEESMQLSLDRIPHSFPEPVQLAFPLSLPIWGRHRDEYHPISVEEQDNATVLVLRHRKDKGIYWFLYFRARKRAGKAPHHAHTAFTTGSEAPRLRRWSWSQLRLRRGNGKDRLGARF